MVPIFNVTLARQKIQLPDDGLRTETCRSSFSVLMCKFYISALVGIIIEYEEVLFELRFSTPSLALHHQNYSFRKYYNTLFAPLQLRSLKKTVLRKQKYWRVIPPPI